MHGLVPPTYLIKFLMKAKVLDLIQNKQAQALRYGYQMQITASVSQGPVKQ